MSRTPWERSSSARASRENAAADKAVAAWNAKHAPGLTVRYWPFARGRDPVYVGETIEPARNHCGSAVVRVRASYGDGTDLIALTHVEVIP